RRLREVKVWFFPGVVEILKGMQYMEKLTLIIETEDEGPAEENELAAALSSWTHPLRHLEIRVLRCNVEAVGGALGAGALCGLTRLCLVLDGSSNSGDLSLTAVLRGLPNLRSLVLQWWFEGPARSLDQMLRDVQPEMIASLRVLSVTTALAFSSPSVPCTIPAAGCLALRAPVSSLHVMSSPCPRSLAGIADEEEWSHRSLDCVIAATHPAAEFET
ncbi:uncharacterized protein LOC113208733, partial [Frankliniella occidentalis]|uniref:Uncharacterized protein LOC113208733 n=1 Tax=Frankliniella occidentalis TaxID=133901 RepID=A0A9C6X9Y0_FRAOC